MSGYQWAWDVNDHINVASGHWTDYVPTEEELHRIKRVHVEVNLSCHNLRTVRLEQLYALPLNMLAQMMMLRLESVPRDESHLDGLPDAVVVEAQKLLMDIALSPESFSHTTRDLYCSDMRSWSGLQRFYDIERVVQTISLPFLTVQESGTPVSNADFDQHIQYLGKVTYEELYRKYSNRDAAIVEGVRQSFDTGILRSRNVVSVTDGCNAKNPNNFVCSGGVCVYQTGCYCSTNDQGSCSSMSI